MPYAKVLQGYVDLADTLRAAWLPRLTKAATQADAGTYPADQLAKDLLDNATLAATSATLVANEAMEALTAIAVGDAPAHVVTGTFATKEDTQERLLTLVGLLQAAKGTDKLTAKIVPPALLPVGTANFTITADATGLDAGFFTGTVEVRDTTGVLIESVAVSLTVA